MTSKAIQRVKVNKKKKGNNDNNDNVIPKISTIPFDYSEVQALASNAGSDGNKVDGDLWQRFIFWKAGEMQTIKEIERVVMSMSLGNNSKLSKNQKLLQREWFDFCVSTEHEKYRVLENVRAPISLAAIGNDDDDNEEEVELEISGYQGQGQGKEEQQQIERIAEIYQ